jgi:hypothetical protein
MINGSPERKAAGLRNFVVFGRAVTNVLQNLRSTEKGFDEWYRPYVDEMKVDELMSYFYKLRSLILKEGISNTMVGMHIKSLRLPDDLRRLTPPPPNAKAFFVGDHLGGSGWEVQLPDGSTEKYYVDLPVDIAECCLHLQNPPKMHLGKVIDDGSMKGLCLLYIDYLHKMVISAKEMFS